MTFWLKILALYLICRKVAKDTTQAGIAKFTPSVVKSVFFFSFFLLNGKWNVQLTLVIMYNYSLSLSLCLWLKLIQEHYLISVNACNQHKHFSQLFDDMKVCCLINQNKDPSTRELRSHSFIWNWTVLYSLVIFMTFDEPNDWSNILFSSAFNAPLCLHAS